MALYRITPAARGMQWLKAAIGMVDRNPRGLLMVSLAFIIIGQLPSLFGSLQQLAELLMFVVLMIGPALAGGLMHAIAEAEAGRPVSLGQLFEAFRRPGRLLPMLVLGMLTVLALLLLVFAAEKVLGPDNIALLVKIGSQQLQPDEATMEQLAQPLLRFLMLATVIAFVLFTGLFFAVPRVLFDGRPPLAAFLESFAACAANVLPLTVYGLAFVALMFVAVLVFAVLSLLLGLLGKLGAALGFVLYLAWLTLVVLVSTSGNYLAWRDVFGHTQSDPAVPHHTGIEV